MENKEDPKEANSYWKRFTTQRANNTLPHALLFTGPAGAGKLKFAQSLTEFFLCPEITSSATQSCGICRSCQLFKASAHPDYRFVTPEEKSKVISVEQIRDLSHKLMHTAQLNHYQVAIISPAHVMNSAAANALLKTLEEPPGKVIIILVSDKVHVLPRTIYSRCQVLAFKQTSTATTPALNQDLYAALLSVLTPTEKKQDPVSLAKFCLDFDFDEVLDCLFAIVTDGIKTSFISPQEKFFENLDLQQHYFHFYDRLLEIKKLQDNGINFNTQSALENLFIKC